MTELPPGLADDPFDHQVTSSSQVRVFRGGRLVTVIGGRDAARLAARLEDADEVRRQHLLARATGNYRQGNEKRPHR